MNFSALNILERENHAEPTPRYHLVVWVVSTGSILSRFKSKDRLRVLEKMTEWQDNQSDIWPDKLVDMAILKVENRHVFTLSDYGYRADQESES